MSFGTAKASNSQNFSSWKLYLSPIHEGCPPWKFPTIRYVRSWWGLLFTGNIKLSTSLELGLVWGWDCTSTRCCMTYYITVCTCAVLKQILHMLRYCCNKLSPSLIIESLAAAKSAGCLQQSLQAVYPCKDVVTICLHVVYSWNTVALATMALACFLIIWNKASKNSVVAVCVSWRIPELFGVFVCKFHYINLCRWWLYLGVQPWWLQVHRFALDHFLLPPSSPIASFLVHLVFRLP